MLGDSPEWLAILASPKPPIGKTSEMILSGFSSLLSGVSSQRGRPTTVVTERRVVVEVLVIDSSIPLFPGEMSHLRLAYMINASLDNLVL